MTNKLEFNKKEQIVLAAQKLFIKNGYEGTSIRMILNEVKGQVGMFYHYFDSKSEVFEAAIKLYLNDFVIDFEELVLEYDSLKECLKSLCQLALRSTERYKKLKRNNFHYSMDIALHQLTINKTIPIVERLIKDAKSKGIIKETIIDDFALASFLVQGCSGLLHNNAYYDNTEHKIEEIICNLVFSTIKAVEKN